jgi:hypothetical protein
VLVVERSALGVPFGTKGSTAMSNPTVLASIGEPPTVDALELSLGVQAVDRS